MFGTRGFLMACLLSCFSFAISLGEHGVVLSGAESDPFRSSTHASGYQGGSGPGNQGGEVAWQ